MTPPASPQPDTDKFHQHMGRLEQMLQDADEARRQHAEETKAANKQANKPAWAQLLMAMVIALGGAFTWYGIQAAENATRDANIAANQRSITEVKQAYDGMQGKLEATAKDFAKQWAEMKAQNARVEAKVEGIGEGIEDIKSRLSEAEARPPRRRTGR